MTSNSPLPTKSEQDETLSVPAAGEPGEANDGEISLLDLMIVIAERKRVVLRTTLIFAVVAIVVSLLLPARYTLATLTLLPPQGRGSSMGSLLASQLGNFGGMAALAEESLES